MKPAKGKDISFLIRENYKSLFGRKLLYLITLLMPLIYLGILIKVVIANYSNVPYWDEWDSRLIMNPKLGHITLSTFWQQHNEHRIVLSKILFFLDFKFFNGGTAPLLVAGILIAITSYALLLIYIWKISVTSKVSKINAVMLSSTSGVLLFSTMQNENFLWAFQSQFLLAILLPFTTIIFSYKYISTQKKYYFFACWAASLFSIGTLASGLLVSVCVVLMNIVCKLKKRQIFVSILLSILEFSLYFYGYKTPNSSPLSVFFHHPLFALKYICLYLSSPFTYLTNGTNYFLMVLAGAIYILVIGVALYRVFSYKKLHRSTVVIPLAMSVYVCVTAAVSAGGRYKFGLDQALASRYTTMSLMGWSCAAIAAIELSKKRHSVFILLTPILISVLLLPQQTKALSINDNQLFDRKIAAVALELNISDEVQLANVYPSAERVLEVSKVLINNHQSIFGDSEILQARKLVGTNLDLAGVGSCVGHVDIDSVVKSAAPERQITGWIFNSKMRQIPKVVLAVDSTNQVTGYGLTGMLRPDVAAAINMNARFSGFKLYANKRPISKLVGFSTSPLCLFKVS